MYVRRLCPKIAVCQSCMTLYIRNVVYVRFNWRPPGYAILIISSIQRGTARYGLSRTWKSFQSARLHGVKRPVRKNNKQRKGGKPQINYLIKMIQTGKMSRTLYNRPIDIQGYLDSKVLCFNLSATTHRDLRLVTTSSPSNQELWKWGNILMHLIYMCSLTVLLILGYYTA